MYSSPVSPTHSTCPTHLIIGDFITLIIFYEQHKLWSSSWCIPLHSLVTSQPLGPNVFFCTPFSKKVFENGAPFVTSVSRVCLCTAAGGRAVYGVGLRTRNCCDCWFESRWRHGCSSHVFAVCCAGSGECDELITRPEESYRECVYVCVCVWSRHLNIRRIRPELLRLAT